MPRYFLKSIAVEGFRGINNESDPLLLEFKCDAVNSVFAVNGLGKSSVFEALLYAIRGTVPKLAELPAAESAESYYVNKFHSGKTAVIDLTFRPDSGDDDVLIRVKRSAFGVRSVTSVSQKTPLRAEICDKSGPPRVGFRPRNRPRRRCLAARGERRQEISPDVRLPRMGGFPSFSGSGHGML